jgi:hypothetical protein
MQPLSILHSAPRIPAQSLQMLKKTQKELYELRTMQKTVRQLDMDTDTAGYNKRRIQMKEDTIGYKRRRIHTRIQPQKDSQQEDTAVEEYK